MRRLYDDAGWIAYTCDMDALERALRASLYLVCAYETGRRSAAFCAPSAMGRPSSIFRDILVLQQYRRHGIGRTMVKMLLEAYPNVRQRVLLTDETPEMHGFYESLGFFPQRAGRAHGILLHGRRIVRFAVFYL